MFGRLPLIDAWGDTAARVEVPRQVQGPVSPCLRRLASSTGWLVPFIKSSSTYLKILSLFSSPCLLPPVSASPSSFPFSCSPLLYRWQHWVIGSCGGSDPPIYIKILSPFFLLRFFLYQFQDRPLVSLFRSSSSLSLTHQDSSLSGEDSRGDDLLAG